MTVQAFLPQRHSAEVPIPLAINGVTLDVAQLIPDFVILKNPPAPSPQDAELALTIDGHQRRKQVRLVDGVPANAAATSIVRIGPSG